MSIWAILNTIFFCVYGIGIITLTIKHWDDSRKTSKIKISELIYGAAYIINGFILLRAFDTVTPEIQDLLYGIMFIAFVAILCWLWVVNILYTYIRVKRHPELMDEDAPVNRHMESYWEELEKEYEKEQTKDIVKDLSRKALHFVILFVVILLHELPQNYESQLQSMGLTPLAVRNFGYYTIAFFFLFMFTTADALRVYKFEVLPDWALKWYGKSVEPSTEKYTYISSVPFLLTLMLFIPANFAIVMAACIVSCISDAVASIVGKNFGKRKMTNFGRYPQKTFEGFFAGASSAFLGVVLVFSFYPMSGVTMEWQLVLGLLAALSFIYVDAFSKYVVDNVLNTLIPGVIVVMVTFLL